MIGIKKLDDMLEGGFKPGFFTLIEAYPMTGPEIFSKQIASTNDVDKVTYFATEETREEVVEDMKAHGWPTRLDVKDYSSMFSERLLREKQEEIEAGAAKSALGANGLRVEDILDSGRVMPVERRKESANYLLEFLRLFSSLSPADKVVVHSLNFFFNLYGIRDVVSVIHAARTINSKNGKLLFATASPHLYEDEVRKIEPFADCIIELKPDIHGERVKNMLYVKKVRGWAHEPVAVPYDITKDGIRIEKMEKVM
ncbi:MAG: hypothetical protein CVT47_00505 [Thermoplasmata archaeon HGW-Thermoplasmata-2]|nr:MAG: hypothetical protein CVT47_00505 [Thermoplasmata archaeon HGW-Thermoplasmata-2]